MNESNHETQAPIILGQKYAYATISLVLGLACFINLAGLEKALLAVIFGWLALKSTPAPALKARLEVFFSLHPARGIATRSISNASRHA